VGDWIRNNIRKWTPRRVDAVIDENTIQVKEISGQSAGDDIERFRYINTIKAE
jgi:hypothetical protein